MAFRLPFWVAVRGAQVRLTSLVAIAVIIQGWLTAPASAQPLPVPEATGKHVWIGFQPALRSAVKNSSRAPARFYLLDTEIGMVIQCSEIPVICNPILNSKRAKDGEIRKRYLPGQISRVTPNWSKAHPRDEFLIYTFDSVTGAVQTCGDIERVCINAPSISTAPPAGRLRISILYRRADTAGVAGRLYDRLIARYGRDAVFMDVYDIPIGSDWREVAKSSYVQSDVIIALIGSAWLTPRNGAASRLFEPDDPVRMEIEAALRGSAKILPLLIDGAIMPRATDLPDTIKRFSDINASVLETGAAFDILVTRIFRSIDTAASAIDGGR